MKKNSPVAFAAIIVLFFAAFAFSNSAFAKTEPINQVEQIAKRVDENKPFDNEEVQAIQDFFKKKIDQKIDLTKGTHKCVIQWTGDGGGFAGWYMKAPVGSKVTIYAEKGRSWVMQPLGKTGYYVYAKKFPNFSSVHFRYDIDGKRLPMGGGNRFGFESYEWSKDSLPQDGVPKGKLVKMPKHVSKRVYPGAERDWWLYIPSQHKPSTKPAKLMVFNDGRGYCQGDGNATIVLDNLIHQKKIPVCVAVFIQPGEYPKKKETWLRKNRSNEYDTCTNQFAEFLEKEILIRIYRKYNISREADDHVIVGASSGGSCAFTAAWHRPDLFRRVISFVGSFCDFRGINDYPSMEKNEIPKDKFGPWKTGHDYPGLIRKTEPPKPLKVFLQDGDNDLDNVLGNWFLNNERMAAALAFSGYDYKFVPGHGQHSSRHGKALLPECIEWIWNDSKE